MAQIEKIDVAQVQTMINEINEKEPAVAQAIALAIRHIHGTYSDKYAKGQNKGIDTKGMLYDPEDGKGINTYQVARYLQRYVTKGSAKSNLLIDLFKMIHYVIFEVTRRIKCGDVEFVEPKN